LDPYDVDVPYSNHQSVATPPGLTVPFTVADVPPTALTEPVIAVGAAAAAPLTRVTAASTPRRTTRERRRRSIASNLRRPGKGDVAGS
jgi:hypothetical protein